MKHQSTMPDTTHATTHHVYRFGFYVAILTAVLTVITFGIAIFTPPISGPSCADSCIDYPYVDDIASRFPRDYLWMYPAMVLTAVFVVFITSIHHYAPAEKKIFSQIGLAFAIMAAAILIVDYFMQVSVIQPSLDNGETDGIALLTQYNPHGIFIALEDIGYLLMSVAFLFVAPVFSEQDRVEMALRWIFAGSFVLVMLSLIVISIIYGIDREYRFEIAAILIDWLALIVAGILVSIVFRRAMQQAR
jgi:hypothetical protein